jgi:hypothetical protein
MSIARKSLKSSSVRIACEDSYQDRIKRSIGPRHFWSLAFLEIREVLLELQCTLDYPG